MFDFKPKHHSLQRMLQCVDSKISCRQIKRKSAKRRNVLKHRKNIKNKK